jgi:hypothetical protein
VYHNAATNVSVNNDNDEFSERVSDEHQAKENLRTKRKDKLSRSSFTFGDGREADERVPSRRRLRVLIESFTAHKKLGDIQRLELTAEFLSNVTCRIQSSKNISGPFNSVPTTSHISCPPTPFPFAASLD